jgi:DNA-binding LacI/PurR family transcriptional regulator
LGGALAARHLIETGRRRLAFFGDPDAPEIDQRLKGFQSACQEMGVADTAEILPVPLTADGAYQTIVDRLAAGPAPDGVVAASDVIAMSAIRAFTEKGLSVPEDVGVVGYDDVMLAAHTTPPLSTVRQDLAQGAALLVDLLFNAMGGRATDSAVMAPVLIRRGSS